MQTFIKIGDKIITVNHEAGTELSFEDGKLTSGVPSHRSLEAQINEALGDAGIQWGDAVKWVTEKLGIEACAACKSRQKILNQAKNLGVAETIRQIKGTFSGSK